MYYCVDANVYFWYTDGASMKATSLQLLVSFLSLMLLAGGWFWVLYAEENQRFAKSIEAQQAYLEELKSVDSERKVYFEHLAANRQAQEAAMNEARVQYEALLKSQAAVVKQQTKATTQIVNKPVVKQQTVTVAKPKTTRKSKTS